MKWLSDSKLSHLRAVVGNSDFSGTKYTCIKELARGGMGTVYLAEDTELNRQVAIKVLSTEEISDDLRRRMIREAQIIARLEHPGIVPVHDVGVLPDGRVFYAMKFVRGVRLDEYAANTSSTKERLRKFQAVCDAVAFAHAHGVIHRDLKPQNIMIGSFWRGARARLGRRKDLARSQKRSLIRGRHPDTTSGRYKQNKRHGSWNRHRHAPVHVTGTGTR